ncbi:uncharacterized protein LOC132204951 isoform X2 [Neocloeon triangulifer]|uniref:uncharacterized protein LOC132204951 isoform X2 n=1 Tax=Neocloeon triangulifer TaxID=2078957 RepID=UPI00286F6981|nr:uncharacterized protein LOC132204951 isoform X2 [Neocloeon triangulifer]
MHLMRQEELNWCLIAQLWDVISIAIIKIITNLEFRDIIFQKNKLLCLKWMAFCQNPFIKDKTPEELSAKQSYFICSQHFDALDYYVKKSDIVENPAPRLHRSRAIPKTSGPSVVDVDGSIISPIKPPANEYAARMIGLKPSAQVESDEEEDDWQYRDAQESFNEIEAAFRENEEEGEQFFPKPLPKPAPKPNKVLKIQNGLFEDMGGRFEGKKVPEYKKLPEDVKRLRSKVHNLQRINNRLKKAAEKRKPTRKQQRVDAIESRRGRRYTLQMKIICLGLYLFDLFAPRPVLDQVQSVAAAPQAQTTLAQTAPRLVGSYLFTQAAALEHNPSLPHRAAHHL